MSVMSPGGVAQQPSAATHGLVVILQCRDIGFFGIHNEIVARDGVSLGLRQRSGVRPWSGALADVKYNYVKQD